LGFSKSLASNAQLNPDIEKRQLPSNGAKNLMGRIQKSQVQGLSLNPQGVIHWELGFKYQD